MVLYFLVIVIFYYEKCNHNCISYLTGNLRKGR